MLDNKKNTRRLGQKLSKNFTYLIMIGNFGTLLITIIYLVVGFERFSENNIMTNAFKTAHINEVAPFLFEIDQSIQGVFQPILNSLYKLEQFSVYISPKIKFDNSKTDFISDRIENAYKTENEGTEENILSKGLWATSDPTITDLSDQKLNTKLNKLYFTVMLNPLLKSIYQLHNKNQKLIQRLYVIFPESDLFYQYPQYKDQTYNSSYHNDYKGWCINSNNQFPNLYYFKCESWYLDAKKVFQITSNRISISYPHQLKSGELGLTVCLNSNIEIENSKEDVLFCADLQLDDFGIKMERLNNELRGFFILTRINTNSLLFYTNQIYSIITDKDNTEFSFNDTYFLDEITKYNNSTSNMIKHFKISEIPSSINDYPKFKGNYTKNGVTWVYSVYPVFLRDPDSKLLNLINIIYIQKDNLINNRLDEILSLDPDIIVAPIILFIVQGLILNLLSKYLVFSIAKNIVLPMKNIKKILDKMNQNDEFINQDEIKPQITNSEEGKNDNTVNDDATNNNEYDETIQIQSKENNEENINNNHIEDLINSEVQSSTQKDSDNESNSSNEDDSEEEEYINIRSRDIQDLFCRLINVRDSLATVNTDSSKVTTRLLPNMLFATEKFGQIKNSTAFYICNSNVGNLLIDCKKYDIAIMHLMESDTFSQKEKGEYLLRMNSKRSDNIGIIRDMNPNGETDRNKKLIESRYPKLLYSFKQFFKNLKRLEKIKEKKYEGTGLNSEVISEIELFSTKKMHMMSCYIKTIENYIFLTNPTISKAYVKNIYAYLEKLEYYIKYELIANKATNGTYQTIKDLINKIKELIKNNKDTTKPKNILKMLIKNELNQIDTVDIPNEVLKQKLNYFEGEIAYKSSHYNEAINYYTKVVYKYGNKISDAFYVVKAFNKLIKIATIYYRKYELLKKEKEMKILYDYIMSKRQEISKFKTINKDYIIIINSYNKSDFLKNALEKSRYIIDNYITNNDRFCLTMTTNQEMKIISKLQYKDPSSTELLYDFIQSLIQDKSFIMNSSLQGEDSIQNMLTKTKAYLIKKNANGERRDVFYIFLSYTISNTSRDFICSEELFSIFNKASENIILLLHDNPIDELKKKKDILAQSKYKQYIHNMQQLTKSEIININDMGKLKTRLLFYGDINLESKFSLEQYIP